MNNKKYKPYPVMNFKERTWPDKVITKAPIWCSVDLRDGNQALDIPMNIDQKIRFFELLIEIGLKEIEVGFPSASAVEYDFMRKLIEEDRIPDDVTIQVLTQAREHLIKKTFESLEGVKKGIVHIYNSTSTLQRNVVFRMSKNEITALAVNAARMVMELKEKNNLPYGIQYTPESFTGTEMDYALEICEAVIDVVSPNPENKLIVNLPATVEMSTPNIYADQIEWFCKNIKKRESIIISIHSHNDRGSSLAASEFAVMAGAERVEGTLFGNGERTGNLDLITMALNLFSQGVDPELDFSDIDKISRIYSECVRMDIHPRHPYAGELVYSAFSGSHQDAINKGMAARIKSKNSLWEVPYLPVDPGDVGRTYRSIIRINSQSGKGGVAYVMEKEFGFELPVAMRSEFGRIIQKIADEKGKELSPEDIRNAFEENYLKINSPYRLNDVKISMDAGGKTLIEANINVNSEKIEIKGEGNGPIDAFAAAIKALEDANFTLKTYDEHAIGKGSDSTAVAYISLEIPGGRSFFGAGLDPNTSIASIKALLSALNRSCRK